ncbi:MULTISPECIES: alpha/beta fold hydrolase [Legionella]|nr:alpha/beta hydrolase [Legionella fallonii]HAU3668146.1 alpha/beta hydrolase [Legionella pneumophila]
MSNKIANDNLSIKLNDGRQLGFAEYGDTNGQPIFYFHGFPGSRLEAGHLHDIAASNRYRLIGIDRPGMGLSSIDIKRSITSWVADVEAFADSLGIEKFSILGHSGGAPFVAACAYMIPHRLNGAAIVSGMAPFENPESQVCLAWGQRIANHMIKAMPWLALVMMKLTAMMLKNSSSMMKQMLKQLPEIDQNVFHDPANSKAIIGATLEAFRNGVGGASQEMKLLLKPWGFDLENIKYPISIWQGALDKQVPASHGTIFANLIPNAQLKLFEHEGHHSLIRNHGEKILQTICSGID